MVQLPRAETRLCPWFDGMELGYISPKLMSQILDKATSEAVDSAIDMGAFQLQIRAAMLKGIKNSRIEL